MRALLAATVLTCVLATSTVPVGAVEATDYAPPVHAPVVDEFRLSAGPYGAGNRGLTYGTREGQRVGSAADGVVAFAGPVAGRLVVSVDHPDGLRTTYTGLATVTVRAGAGVRQGSVVGTAGAELHFGVRSGRAYLDPADLLGGVRRVYLVADEIDRPIPTWMVDGGGGGLPGLGIVRDIAEAGHDAVTGAGGAAWRRVRSAGEAFGELLGQVLDDLHYTWDTIRQWSPLEVLGRMAEVFGEWLKECTPSSVSIPVPSGERRILVVVGGLRSTSWDGLVEQIDPARMGYDEADVVRFSYAGGAVPGTGEAIDTARTGYVADDTEVGVRHSAAELDALLADVRQSAPGVPIDIVAHSLGGVVVRQVIAEEGTGVERVVTLATPHRGADLASLGRFASGTDAGEVVDVVDDLTFDLLPALDSPAMADLAEHSEVIRELPPVADDVDLTSVAAHGDQIVASPQTRVPGERSTVVDGWSHGGLPGSEAGRRETALALAGMPPTCRGLLSSFGAAAFGELVSLRTDGLGMIGVYATYRNGWREVREGIHQRTPAEVAG